MKKRPKHRDDDLGELIEITLLRRILHECQDIAMLLRILVTGGIAQSATLTIKGDTAMPPVTLTVGKTATALLHEWDQPNGAGNEVKPIGPVTYTSDDPSVATVDATSGLITGVAVSKTDASGNPVPVNISGVDAGNGLNASGQVVVTAAALPAVSATLTITPN